MLHVENLFLAIRCDLGHANEGVTRGKILAIFVNDINQLLQPRPEAVDSPTPTAASPVT